MKRREGGGGFALCSDDFDFAFSPDFVVKSSRVLPPSSVRRCIKSTVTFMPPYQSPYATPLRVYTAHND